MKQIASQTQVVWLQSPPSQVIQNKNSICQVNELPLLPVLSQSGTNLFCLTDLSNLFDFKPWSF